MKSVVEINQMCSGQVGGHHYVDLGLPSGLKWAVCNIGASEPWEFGDYFAWGEVSPKEDYSNETYKWGMWDNLTKYCTNPTSLKTYGMIDNKKMLEIEDDAAAVNWGNGWHTPSVNDMLELGESCEWEKDIKDFEGSGIGGFVGHSKYNGNSIFFPDAGRRVGFETLFSGNPKYFASEINYSDPSDCFIFVPNSFWSIEGRNARYVGYNVRAVININNDKI